MPCSDCSSAPPAVALAGTPEAPSPVPTQFTMWNCSGTVVRDPKANSRATGTWKIDGRTYTITFNLSNSVPWFECKQACLVYNDPDNLTGTRTFHGLIGPDQISLTLIGLSNVTISGWINNRPIDVNASVNGTGVWQNS